MTGQTYCGGYDNAGALTYADALLIPLAQKTTANKAYVDNNFCGQGQGFVTGNAGNAGKVNQVCCK